MPLSPKAGLALAALAALSLVAARPAAAQTTITFDDLSDNGSGTPIANGYQGLNWSNFYVLNTNQFPVPSGYQPGTVSGTNVAYNGGVPEAINSVTPGSTFTLNSGYFTAAWHDNLNLTVTALHNGLTVFSKSVTLSATAPTLVNFDFTGVDQVNFDSSGGTHHAGYGGDGTQFALDNLTINGPASTPEPSSFAAFGFVGLGLAGLALKARKKAAAPA